MELALVERGSRRTNRFYEVEPLLSRIGPKFEIWRRSWGLENIGFLHAEGGFLICS